MNIELRYRARVEESIPERHTQIVAGLLQLEPPRGLKGKHPPAPPDIGAKLRVEVDLTNSLGSGNQGVLSYVLRSDKYLRDESEFDDLMIVGCEFAQPEFEVVVRTVFRLYIEAFTPYRATIILDTQLYGQEWPTIVRLGKDSGKDADGRDGVYRINSVNYFDRELCRRAFGLSPEEIVERLRNKVESVSILLDGVVLIVTSAMVDRETLKGIDAMVRTQLGI